MDDMENHERLRKIWDVQRKRLKLSQAEAGRRIGIKQTTFSQYLNGSTPFNDAFAYKAGQLFGCNPKNLKPDYKPPAELLMVSDDPTPAQFVPKLRSEEILKLAHEEAALDDFKRTVDPELPSGTSQGIFVMEAANNVNYPLITAGARVAVDTTRGLSIDNFHVVVLNGAPLIAMYNGFNFEFRNGTNLNAQSDNVIHVGQAIHVLRRSLIL